MFQLCLWSAICLADPDLWTWLSSLSLEMSCGYKPALWLGPSDELDHRTYSFFGGIMGLCPYLWGHCPSCPAVTPGLPYLLEQLAPVAPYCTSKCCSIYRDYSLLPLKINTYSSCVLTQKKMHCRESIFIYSLIFLNNIYQVGIKSGAEGVLKVVITGSVPFFFASKIEFFCVSRNKMTMDP